MALGMVQTLLGVWMGARLSQDSAERADAQRRVPALIAERLTFVTDFKGDGNGVKSQFSTLYSCSGRGPEGTGGGSELVWRVTPARGGKLEGNLSFNRT